MKWVVTLLCESFGFPADAFPVPLFVVINTVWMIKITITITITSVVISSRDLADESYDAVQTEWMTVVMRYARCTDCEIIERVLGTIRVKTLDLKL